jgi:hypothetical protein
MRAFSCPFACVLCQAIFVFIECQAIFVFMLCQAIFVFIEYSHAYINVRFVCIQMWDEWLRKRESLPYS